ncbi:interleukin-1 beta-like [Coregonus clupeaformis]|uniref:interleukin-1 beta-like n=1 Tax=Coregonus clupeaformis TaxID=59861 RepID=UPI001BE11E31|nr:interleukin-1 beta-like [Coregonus clupeaformis]
MEFESNCCLMKNTSDSVAWSSKLPHGLDVEISHHPRTLRCVVNLIIAMERINGGKAVTLGTEFRDEDLFNFLLESAMEEHTVIELESMPTERGDASRSASGFSSTGEYECSVTDSENKCWVLNSGSMELHAIMLQGGSSYHKVHLNLSTYVTLVPSDTEARPVALGIKGSNLYLSCQTSDGTPTLRLEEVVDKEQLKSINRQSDMVRFLFYRRDTGVDGSTLESAQFRNWFISTALQQDNTKPVEMCQRATPNRFTTFTIQRHN